MGVLNLTCRNRFRKAAGRTYPELVKHVTKRDFGVSAPMSARGRSRVSEISTRAISASF